MFFDNLVVHHKRGPLLQTEDYYPFGMTMAGISDKAPLRPEGKRKFNGMEFNHREFSDGSGLEIYTAKFRGLDPQLGRWMQVDPRPDFSVSPYAAMGNNPMLFTDPLGDTTILGGTLPELPVYGNYPDWYRETYSQWQHQQQAQAQREKREQANEDVISLFESLQSEPGDDRNPAQDKKLTPGDIKRLKEYGWNHRKKGNHGGQTDLYRDPKTGEIYQKPKDGRGYGEPIGINWNDVTQKTVKVGVGVAIGIALWETVKWSTAILGAPETGGASLGLLVIP